MPTFPFRMPHGKKKGGRPRNNRKKKGAGHGKNSHRKSNSSDAKGEEASSAIAPTTVDEKNNLPLAPENTLTGEATRDETNNLPLAPEDARNSPPLIDHQEGIEANNLILATEDARRGHDDTPAGDDTPPPDYQEGIEANNLILATEDARRGHDDTPAGDDTSPLIDHQEGIEANNLPLATEDAHTGDDNTPVGADTPPPSYQEAVKQKNGKGSDAVKTRSIRGVNVYGAYKGNTMTPWQNARNEGREGDPVDNSQAKHWIDMPHDFRDKGTPDEWIPRDGRMVRLTGRHPFNSETPVSEMLKEGFFTPPNLHIIRNHGAVPKLDWETHTLSIGGPSVPNPFTLSMDQLVNDFPQTEFPVTISCCGNRRKEMNMIKQTIGFNWGTGAVSTCIYRGVLLRDLLIHAGLDPLDTAYRHVEFIGTEDLPNKAGDVGPFADEPWGEKCKYGTSIPLEKAMSLADEVMIAFKCNGDRLHPDRGYPCRVIVPGYIGGRMVKWLAKINVIPHESHSHYHYWDNKCLPPQITAEKAKREGWWYKQEYIINELSLNSVITYPNHGEALPVHEYIDSTMTLRGYAHSGGGRPVTRVEISTSQGEWWDLAEIHRTEKPNPYGKTWCWVWWTFELDCASLTDEIWVRAWDTSNNPQPENPVWTLMGQASNHVFRIKVHVGKTDDGKAAYKFEHPTQPGQQTGGWATRVGGKFKSAGYGPIEFDEPHEQRTRTDYNRWNA